MILIKKLAEVCFSSYWYAMTIKRAPGAFKKTSILEEFQYKRKEEIEKTQFEMLKALLRNAFTNSPFYHERLSSIQFHPPDMNDWKDFAKIPILKKRDIQLNLDNIISKKANSSSLIKDATGGSTGEPLIFYHDRVTKEWFEACDIFVKRWWGIKPWSKKAILWGADKDIPEMTNKEKLKLKLERIQFLNSFNMNPHMMHHYAKVIQKLNPEYIQGYASSLYLFARFLKEKNVDLRKPKAIRSSAETLNNYQRHLIEEVLGNNLYNFYGSREIPNIAAECPAHKGLHILSPIRYVEVLSSNGEKVNPGEPGKIVVTDLVNYAMPFVRYEIGDIGAMAENQCTCGRTFPLLKEIKGRESDFIQTRDGKYIHGEFFTHLFYGLEGIAKFQVHQKDLTSIIIFIVKYGEIKLDGLNRVKKKIKDRVGIGSEVMISFVDEIPIPKSGKHRFTISEVPPAF